jgi:hypothetical protein
MCKVTFRFAALLQRRQVNSARGPDNDPTSIEFE